MPDPLVVSALGIAAAKILDAATSQATGAVSSAAWDRLWSRFGPDQVGRALRAALGDAVKRYASSTDRVVLVAPLLARRGPLRETSVAAELGQVLTANRDPDLGIIAAAWAASVEPPVADVDFEHEAAVLVASFRDAVRNTDSFAPRFDSAALDSIADSTSAAALVLEEMEERFTALVELLASGFATASRHVASAGAEIREHIRDATSIIEDKTRDFVGRSMVFAAIDDFGRQEGGGYFFVRGDPGIGKSSIAAELVQRNGCAHHFNSRAGGVSPPRAFLENVSAQLVALHGLPYERLPERAGQDVGTLMELLTQATRRLAPDDRLLVVVDALDEADSSQLRPGQNPLFLPEKPPTGVVIVVTMQNVPLHVTRDVPSRTLVLEPGSQSNQDDIREYLERVFRRARMRAYIESVGGDVAAMIEGLAARSAGNFMYLHHVLPELEKGTYQIGDVDELPNGLVNYYRSHWHRMRGVDEAAWFAYKQPVLLALSVAPRPISLDLLCRFAQVDDRRRVQAVVEEWRAFLHDDVVELDGVPTKRFSIYHRSFQQFIESLDEVADGVDRMAAMRRMTAILLAGSPFVDP